MLVRGDKLSPEARAEVLRAFIYRWTFDNEQREKAYHDIGEPTIPPVSDQEWLAAHAFHVTESGRLSHSRVFAEPACMAEEEQAN